MELDERIRRSQEAEMLWNSPIMREAREHIERQIVEGFKSTPLRDDEGLIRVRLMLEMHKAYEGFFKAALEDGKLAKMDLERKKTLGQRLRQVI